MHAAENFETNFLHSLRARVTKTLAHRTRVFDLSRQSFERQRRQSAFETLECRRSTAAIEANRKRFSLGRTKFREWFGASGARSHGCLSLKLVRVDCARTKTVLAFGLIFRGKDPL